MVEQEVEFTLPIYLNFIEQSVFRMDEDFNCVEI